MTWRRLWHDIVRAARGFDHRKPLHLVAVGAILAAVIAPVADKLATDQRYRLDSQANVILQQPSKALSSKLGRDDDKHATVFNALAAQPTQDKLAMAVGAGSTKSSQLYSATMPDQPRDGIGIHDNVNNVDVSFQPLVSLLDGRREGARVIYPMQTGGQIVYTPRANGLKEDIYLTSSPSDSATYRFALNIPDTLEARMEPSGGIGFYSGDPSLFGNITYGTDNDRKMVEQARRNAPKNYLMFEIPAPTIVQGSKHAPSKVGARFHLDKNILTLTATGLSKAVYPLSIDPTFFIASTQDFLLGSSDDNVDLSVANQVGRAALSGGSLGAWSTTANSLLTSNFSFGLTAYNGCMYALGGGNNGVATVSYTKLSTSTGNTTQTWATTTAFNTGRVGAQGFGYNGYVYIVGGENGAGTTQYATVEYAKINPDCTLGTWQFTSSMNTARAFLGSAIYQGVVYAFGGETAQLNGTLTAAAEYARINGDGSIGTWTNTTILTSPRDRFSAAAYNGFVYVTGGLTNSTTTTALLQYAPINSDGSIGTWVTGNSFPTARRDHGMGIERGHVYVYAGCSSGIACSTFLNDTEYAVVNADGSVGDWQQTNNMNNARAQMATAFYNGHLYSAGGCSTETSGSNNCKKSTANVYYTSFDTPGRFDNGVSTDAAAPYNNTSTLARGGGQTVALNGYIYYVGGCSVSGCATYSPTVEYAQINANGTLANFITTTALSAQAGDSAGRFGHSLMAYNNKIYVIGGEERTTGGAESFQTSVISATQNSDGTLGAWGNEANALPAARAWHSTVLWHNYLYVIGGRDATTQYGTIYYSQIGSSGALGAWSTATQSVTARWGAMAWVYGNWIYVTGGNTDTAGTATTSTQQSTIASSGDITTAFASTTALGTALRYSGVAVHNGFVYITGGLPSASTTVASSTYWASLDPNTGAVGSWSNTNIGNFTTPYGLATARTMTSTTAAGGYLYAIGGCTTVSSTSNQNNCTAFVTTANTTERYLINNGGTGQTNAFSSVTALPSAIADHTVVAYNGSLYSIGGCASYSAGVCNGNQTTVSKISINPDNTLAASWAAQTALPSARSLLGAVAYSGYLYVVAGRTSSSATSATVWYAPISASGAIGTWVDNSSNYLPTGQDRSNFGLAVSQGYLYVAGGQDVNGNYLSSVLYAKLAADGSIATNAGCGSAWCTSTSFTTARAGFGFVAYNGVLYVVGGTNGANLTDIQYASLNTDGSVPAWRYTTDVQRGASARQVIAANGYFYIVGDEGSGTEVTYMDINANGTLGAVHRSASVMSSAHAHGAGVLADGGFYILGGCSLSGSVCGSVAASDEYAGQKAIARAAHYSKLFDTQVDTSPTQLVINGAYSGPGSAVQLRFQTASESDPTLGIAQVIQPVVFGNYYNVQALNSSGQNVGVAFDYFIVLVFDDSRSGTFPDVNQSSSETSVSNITLYYHANPTRRLRHGASFTNTGCNATPANGCILDTAP